MLTPINLKASPQKGGVSKGPSSISANTVFLACNFNNKRVKEHFNRLQRRWEDTYPVRVYLSDKVMGAGARDLWEDITQTIREANLAIFDVTYFRPNVILELGFALAHKDHRQIVICRDLTPGGRTKRVQKKWRLSDIGHLSRIEYKLFKKLDEELLAHLLRMSIVKNFEKFMREIESKYASRRMRRIYIDETRRFLCVLRDEGPISRHEFRSRLEKWGIDSKMVGRLLIRLKLAIATYGKNGAWKLID